MPAVCGHRMTARKKKRDQELVEYVLIIAVVLVACFLAVSLFGDSVSTLRIRMAGKI